MQRLSRRRKARLGSPAALCLLCDVAEVAAAHAGRRGRQLLQVVAAELLRIRLQNLLPAPKSAPQLSHGANSLQSEQLVGAGRPGRQVQQDRADALHCLSVNNVINVIKQRQSGAVHLPAWVKQLQASPSSVCGLYTLYPNPRPRTGSGCRAAGSRRRCRSG